MKRIVLLFSFFFASIITCLAQDYQEVVYMKNGSVIRGFIIEIIPDEYLDIRTTSGRVRSIEMYDVERIVKERVRTDSRTQNDRRDNISTYNTRTPQNNNRPSQNDNRYLQNDNRYSQNDYRYSQNDNRYSQNDYRSSQNNNRYAQNNAQYDARNNYDYYDDRYYSSGNSVHFGVKTGLNLADTRESDTNFKAGFHGGIFGEFKFNNFALQPELLFSMQGAKAKDEEITAKLNLNYLNIPLMAKYYIVDGLCIEIGPQLGILLSAKAIGEASVVGINASATVDVKNYMKDIDFSLNFGASYQIPNLPLGFYARYCLGLTDIYKEVAIIDESGKNSVFQLGAFVKF